MTILKFSTHVRVSSAPGPHEDLLSQDPAALGDRARGLQARRDRLEAEEAELFIEIEILRARGRDYFRDTAAWLRQNTGIARVHRPHPSPCRPPAGGPARRPGRLGRRAGSGSITPGSWPITPTAPIATTSSTKQTEIIGWAVALDAEAFRDRMTDWARDLDEARDAGLIRRGTPAPPAEADPLPDQGRACAGPCWSSTTSPTPPSTAPSGTPRRRCNAPTGRPSCPSTSNAASVRSWPTLRWRWPAGPGAPMCIDQAPGPPRHPGPDRDVGAVGPARVRGWCQLDDGTRLTANQIRRLACEADILPMVLERPRRPPRLRPHRPPRHLPAASRPAGAAPHLRRGEL